MAPQHTTVINTIEQMIEHNVKWAYNQKTFLVYTRHNFPKLADLAVYNTDPKNFCGLFKKHKIAIMAHMEIHSGGMFADQKIDISCRGHLRKLKVSSKNTLIVGSLKKNSPYKKIFDKNIRRFWEHGFIARWYCMAFQNSTSYAEEFESAYVYKYTLSKLNIGKLMGAFYLLIVGEMFAFIVFLWEVFLLYFNRRI